MRIRFFCGGYKYFKKAEDGKQFHDECVRLVNDIHYFDCLRSDRSVSNNGLEARVPFVDHELVEFASTIPIKYKLKWKSRFHQAKSIFTNRKKFI